MPALMKSPEHHASVAKQLVECKLQNLVRLHDSGAPNRKLFTQKKDILSTVEELYSRSDGWQGGIVSLRNGYWDAIDLMFFRLSGKSPFFNELHKEEVGIFDRQASQKFIQLAKEQPISEKCMG